MLFSTPSHLFPWATIKKTTFVIAVALFMSACSAGDSTAASDPTNGDEVESLAAQTTEATATQEAERTQPETTEAADESTTIDESDWPGDLLEISPSEGATMSVVGVRFDDVLNVRSGPGAEFDITTSLEPTGTAVATGRAWNNGGFWYEVSTGNETGWAAMAFFAYIGPSDNATSDIAQLGEVLEAETMPELGELVAITQGDEEVGSSVVQVSNPASGDPNEVTYDVLDIGDGSVYGFRLRITGQETSAGRFEVTGVERITLCGRGLTDSLCA